jgi:hypothetical protein
MRYRIILLLSLGLTGCIALPVPLGEGYVSAGREIPADTETRFTLGTTTRAEAVASLGEPSATWDEAGIIVYDWDRVRWLVLWLIGGRGGGAAGAFELPDHHMLILRFDQAGILRRAEHALRPEGTSYGAFLRQWATP